MSATFEGFKPDAVRFLLELRANNERAWFQSRKSEFERLLKEPLEALCAAVGERFVARRIPLLADVRSPFRIYRDMRFSKDKLPYKTHVAASFAWAGDGAPKGLQGKAEQAHGAGGYFHFGPDEAWVGGGLWRPERPLIEAWRSLVTKEPKRLHQAIDAPAFTRAFGQLDGDRLLRVPPGYPPDHPDAELLKLKDVTFGRRLASNEVMSRDLPEILADALAIGVPVMRLLAELSS